MIPQPAKAQAHAAGEHPRESARARGLCRPEDQFVIAAHSVYFLEYRHYSRKLLFVRSVAIDQSISPDLPWVAYVIIFEPPIESIVVLYPYACFQKSVFASRYQLEISIAVTV